MKPLSDFAPAFEQRTGGYQPGIPFDAYKAWPSVNASLLKKTTALEMKETLTGSSDDDDADPELGEWGSMTESRAYAYTVGSASHMAILEPDLFDQDDKLLDFYAYSPTKGLVTDKANALRLADPSRMVVTPEIIGIAKRCRDSVHAHHHAARLLTNTDNELSGQVWDAEFEVMRKVRLDARGGREANYLADLKSTRNALTISRIRHEVWDRGYHLQAAWYLDTENMLMQENRQHFHFIFYRTSAPFMCRVFTMHPDFIEKGRELYKERLGMLTQAWNDRQWCAYEHEEPVMLQA